MKNIYTLAAVAFVIWGLTPRKTSADNTPGSSDKDSITSQILSGKIDANGRTLTRRGYR